MRTYERSGITVDQCSECRGIFLDRGELERLVDAETSFHSPEVAVPRPAGAPNLPGPAYGSQAGDPYRDERYRGERSRDDRPREDKDRDDRYRDDQSREDRYRDDRYRSSDQYYDKRKKKRSFLEDLFD